MWSAWSTTPSDAARPHMTHRYLSRAKTSTLNPLGIRALSRGDGAAAAASAAASAASSFSSSTSGKSSSVESGQLGQEGGDRHRVGAPVGWSTMEPATKTAVERGSRRSGVYGHALGGVPINTERQKPRSRKSRRKNRRHRDIYTTWELHRTPSPSTSGAPPPTLPTKRRTLSPGASQLRRGSAWPGLNAKGVCELGLLSGDESY